MGVGQNLVDRSTLMTPQKAKGYPSCWHVFIHIHMLHTLFLVLRRRQRLRLRWQKLLSGDGRMRRLAADAEFCFEKDGLNGWGLRLVRTMGNKFKNARAHVRHISPYSGVKVHHGTQRWSKVRSSTSLEHPTFLVSDLFFNLFWFLDLNPQNWTIQSKAHPPENHAARCSWLEAPPGEAAAARWRPGVMLSPELRVLRVLRRTFAQS